MTARQLIAPTPRRSMTKARAARIFLAHNGTCHICGNAIRDGEKWEAEHRIALTLGGADDDSNLAPAHVKCHAGKTADDRRADAKRNRIVSAGYAGRQSSRGFRGWRKFNGEPVYVKPTSGHDRDAQTAIEGGER